MKIPKEIKNGCPEKCPVCSKDCVAVFRHWKPKDKKVICDFVHNTSKECKKTYDY